MGFRTPNSHNAASSSNDAPTLRQGSLSQPDNMFAYEPSPTIEHLRTKNYKLPSAINSQGNQSSGHRNILNDLEKKIAKRNNAIYRPISCRSSRKDNAETFKEKIRERKTDKVMYNREFMDYKNSKEENERIMNEIAANMSLSIEDYDTAEQSIDAILGFSDEIYDSKSRPRYFDMVDEFDPHSGKIESNSDQMLDVDEGNKRYLNSSASTVSPPPFLESAIQNELEELLRLQEEELEYLASNLSLN